MSAYGVADAQAGYSGRAVFRSTSRAGIIHKDVAANPGDMAQVRAWIACCSAARVPQT